jgi:hypothetical protein
MLGTDELVGGSIAGWRSTEVQSVYASVSGEERAAAATRLEALLLNAQTCSRTYAPLRKSLTGRS